MKNGTDDERSRDENVNMYVRIVTQEGRIRYNYIKGNIKVPSTVWKTRENKVRWFGHVMR